MHARNKGSISALVVCSAMGLMTLAGLVYDGGRVVSNYAELSDIAENAARVGSQQITGIRSGHPQIDSNQAKANAREFLASYGIDSHIETTDSSVKITCRKTVPMTLLSLAGITARTIEVTRTVQVVRG